MSSDGAGPEAEAELAAARRTVAVLKERVRVMQSGSQNAIQKQLEAARRREEENRRRRELMELRTAELGRYSSKLEAEVQSRTLAMRRILNNVTFGFLFVRQDLNVQAECTDSCRTLFEAPTVEGRTLVELLRLPAPAAAMYRLDVEQVFEDIMPLEVTIAQMKKDFRVGDRVVRAEPSAVRDAGGSIEGLLYTLSDITDLLAAQRESAENRMLVKLLRNKPSFRAFVEDTKQLVDDAIEAIELKDEASVRRIVHTIKGNSASYQLGRIVDELHLIEDGPITLRSIDRIRSAFVNFLAEHESVLGMRFDSDAPRAFEVSQDQVRQLKLIVSETGSLALHGWASAVTRRPAEVLLGPIEAFAEALGERLGKRVAMNVVGGQTLVDDDRMRPVLQTLVHLVRNAVDHAIEPGCSRGEKPETGRLSLSIRSDGGSFEIEFSDDGAGIDTDRVVERALEAGALFEGGAQALTHRQRLELVFLDGVSSAAEVSDLSGRGVGLSAVRSAVWRAGGTIAVASSRGVGTTFTIRIPATCQPSQRPSQPPPLKLLKTGSFQ